MAARPNAKHATVFADRQPQLPPSVTPSVRAPTPAAIAAVPTGSGMRRSDIRPGALSSRRAVITRKIPNGRLMTNTDRQLNHSMRTPPMLGPTAAPNAEAALHTPIELARRPAGPSRRRIASEAGIIAAAPAP